MMNEKTAPGFGLEDQECGRGADGGKDGEFSLECVV